MTRKTERMDGQQSLASNSRLFLGSCALFEKIMECGCFGAWYDDATETRAVDTGSLAASDIFGQDMRVDWRIVFHSVLAFLQHAVSMATMLASSAEFP